MCRFQNVIKGMENQKTTKTNQYFVTELLAVNGTFLLDIVGTNAFYL